MWEVMIVWNRLCKLQYITRSAKFFNRPIPLRVVPVNVSRCNEKDLSLSTLHNSSGVEAVNSLELRFKSDNEKSLIIPSNYVDDHITFK